MGLFIWQMKIGYSSTMKWRKKYFILKKMQISTMKGFGRYIWILCFPFLKLHLFSYFICFRSNPHYIFFLLQITEAVNLKRAESTAFRKASRLSKYTNTYLKETDKATLQRTNQGYRQFKSMRGTAPYYQNAKHKLFSMIRWERGNLNKKNCKKNDIVQKGGRGLGQIYSL